MTTLSQNTNVDVRVPLTSADVLGERIEQLRDLIPEALAEWQIDFDRLRNALGDFVGEGRERYGLSWAGKADAIRAIQAPSVGTLVPCPEDSLNFDTTENVFIEGDNLEVLKLLQKSYYGKVKMIYIDPPYNTGNEFIYPDNFREGLEDYLKYSGQVGEGGIKLSTNTEASGRYHSRWLNMMYPRIFLARNLLMREGVIFVSIDDHEVHNLRLLLNEVFGEENFIASFVWQKRYSRDNRPVVGTVHDYVLLYAREAEAFAKVRGLLPPEEESTKVYRNPNNDPRGRWRPIPMTAQGTRKNQMYEITTPAGVVHEPPPGRCWDKVESEYNKLLSNGRIWFGKDQKGQPNVIRYLDEVEGFVPWTWWPHEETGHTDEAKKEIHSFFGKEEAFDTPKPLRLMKRILHLATTPNEDAIVMDFFAGSGSMGHAVYEQNAEDGGNRRFILVQLPEPIEPKTSERSGRNLRTIADICSERLRLSSEDLTGAKKGKLEFDNNEVGDVGLRVFRLSKSNFQIWEGTQQAGAEELQDQLQLFADHILPDRSEQDVLYELLLKAGVPLTAANKEKKVAGKTVHWIADGMLAICLANPLSQDCLRGIIELEPKRVTCLDAAFGGNDQLKTNTVLEMKSHGIEFRTV